jgi:phosphatidylglycerophosphatase A
MSQKAVGTALENTGPVRPRAGRLAWLLATFFGAGKLRPGPGTWGSLAALGLWRAAAPLMLPEWRAPAAILAAATALAAGIPAATRVARESGDADPPYVVIDEVCGQWIALAGAPLTWKSQIAAFVLFRAFDILKPPPLRKLERIPGGAGIMLDDVGAGVYAFLLMQLLLRFGILN